MLNTLLLTALFAAPAISETVFGAVVFTRHGDRTAKFYSGYQMTNLGATQVFDSGQFYRQRYIEEGAPSQIAGIASDRVDYRQVWASAPDQGVLFQTAQNFLQGLYPPLSQLDQQLSEEILTNGTAVTDPLNGYQFILVHGEGESDPDTIWIKGSDACPAYSTAIKSYTQSAEYKSALNETADFYSRFEGLLGPIMGAENVTFKNAYDVFDLLNVASIHNTSVAAEINEGDLDQLRYLADEWEWNRNFNASQPDRSIGGMTLAGAFLERLEALTDAGARRNKFQLMAGSYNVFMQFFGLVNLTAANEDFSGLPGYASSMAVEVFSNEGSAASPASFPAGDAVRNDLRVRFLFRNGSDSTDQLTTYPLFGGEETTLTYGQFVDELGARAINNLGEWCETCGAVQDFCVAANASASASSSQDRGSSEDRSSSGSSLSNAAAGGIGAGVTLAVVAIVGGLVWLMTRRKKGSAVTKKDAPREKRMSDSENETV